MGKAIGSLDQNHIVDTKQYIGENRTYGANEILIAVMMKWLKYIVVKGLDSDDGMSWYADRALEMEQGIIKFIKVPYIGRCDDVDEGCECPCADVVKNSSMIEMRIYGNIPGNYW